MIIVGDSGLTKCFHKNSPDEKVLELEVPPPATADRLSVVEKHGEDNPDLVPTLLPPKDSVVESNFFKRSFSSRNISTSTCCWEDEGDCSENAVLLTSMF